MRHRHGVRDAPHASIHESVGCQRLERCQPQQPASTDEQVDLINRRHRLRIWTRWSGRMVQVTPSDWIALGLSLNGGIVTLDQQRWQPAFLRAASWNMGNCESLLLLDTSYSFPVRIKIFTNVCKLMLLFEYAQLSVFMPVRLLKKLCTDREYGTQRFEWSSVHTKFRQLVNNLLNS